MGRSELPGPSALQGESPQTLLLLPATASPSVKLLLFFRFLCGFLVFGPSPGGTLLRRQPTGMEVNSCRLLDPQADCAGAYQEVVGATRCCAPCTRAPMGGARGPDCRTCRCCSCQRTSPPWSSSGPTPYPKRLFVGPGRLVAPLALSYFTDLRRLRNPPSELTYPYQSTAGLGDNPAINDQKPAHESVSLSGIPRMRQAVGISARSSRHQLTRRRPSPWPRHRSRGRLPSPRFRLARADA